jgi:predicted nucleotidyltransferase
MIIKRGNREQLLVVERKVTPALNKLPQVSKVTGIGSYWTAKKHPNDLDYLLHLDDTYENIDFFQLSDSIENIKNSFKDDKKGDTVVNIFLIDGKGRFLNSIDLWFHCKLGEPLEYEARANEAKEHRVSLERCKVL